MKRLFSYLVVGLLTFTMACDKEDGDGDVNGSCLLSKVTWTEDDGDTETSTLEYDSDKKLVKVTSMYEGRTEFSTFSYDAQGRISLITSTNTEGVESNRTKYTWGDNTLEEVYQSKNTDGDWADSDYKSVKQLNGDGKIVKDTYYYLNDGEWVSSSYYTEFTWTNGNNTKYEEFEASSRKIAGLGRINERRAFKSPLKSGTSDAVYTTTMEYDDKNNPYKPFGVISGVNGLNANNVTKYKYSSTSNNEQDDEMVTYEYNGNNYPSKQTLTYSYDGKTATDVVMYEYNCD